MVMDIKASVLTELQTRRAKLADRIAKLDIAIEEVKNLNGLDLRPNPTWVTTKGPESEKISFQVPEVIPFVKSYIRKVNKPGGVPMKELFENYFGRRNWKKGQRTSAYQTFSSKVRYEAMHRKTLKLTCFKIQGVGRESLVDVTSAMDLQTEKQVPGQVITDVKQ